jgi:hypothetical protein
MFGVDVEAQRWLLHAIVKRAAASSPTPSTACSPATVQPAESIIELLSDGNETNAPAVVLAVVLNGGGRDTETVAITLSRIGFELSRDDIQATLLRMPDQTTDEMEQALRQSGWGAYLRRGRSVLANGGVE